jgi:DNA-directed RNA polymerase subunit RPC12/RpoP
MRPSESFANSHRGEPCCCAECPKTFAWFRSLNQHARIHTGEKPYKCSHCGHSFSRENNFKTHVRINTGEKSCKCPHCSDSFSRKSYFDDTCKQLHWVDLSVLYLHVPFFFRSAEQYILVLYFELFKSLSVVGLCLQIALSICFLFFS